VDSAGRIQRCALQIAIGTAGNLEIRAGEISVKNLHIPVVQQQVSGEETGAEGSAVFGLKNRLRAILRAFCPTGFSPGLG
jgi:hypothetical protein